MASLVVRAAAAAVVLLLAFGFAKAQDSEKPRVMTDDLGNIYIATGNSTVQKVFLNGVDVLAELSTLFAHDDHAVAELSNLSAELSKLSTLLNTRAPAQP
jgi:hypothetical protein